MTFKHGSLRAEKQMKNQVKKSGKERQDHNIKKETRDSYP